MITHLTTPEALRNDEVLVQDDAYRHLFRARRLAAGDRLRVVDGKGRARWATVDRVDRRRAALVLAQEAPPNEPSYRLTLLVAALRPERASWLVEKATEIGAVAVRFLATERTPRRYGKGQLGRWRRVASASLEQCHRSLLPEVTGVHDWTELAGLVGESGERWFLDLAGRPWERRAAGASSGAVLIGPEGGWSPPEREELERLGAAPVTLGARVLRVETAALAAASAILLPGVSP